MNFTKTPMLRLAAVLGLGAMLLTSAPADAKPKGHGKAHKKWQKQARKEEKRWAKQERKDAKRWEKDRRERDDWEDRERDNWDDDYRRSDRDPYFDRSSTSGNDWWQDLLSQGLRRR